MVNAFNTCMICIFNKSKCPAFSLNANTVSVFPFWCLVLRLFVLTPCVDGCRRLYTDLDCCCAHSDSSGFHDLFIAPS